MNIGRKIIDCRALLLLFAVLPAACSDFAHNGDGGADAGSVLVTIPDASGSVAGTGGGTGPHVGTGGTAGPGAGIGGAAGTKPGTGGTAGPNAGTGGATSTTGTGGATSTTGTGGANGTGGTAGPNPGTGGATTSACAQAPVALGAAASFVVLAGSTVTNTGLTSATGDLGVSPGTAVTGFGPGVLVGAQHAGDPTSAQAEAALTTAYNDAAGRTLCPISVAGNLGGQTLIAGLYKSTTSLEISSGDLTLDASGNAAAVFIFQMASTLNVTSGRKVILIGGASAANIFWQVGSSATLGTTSALQGNILADQSIALAAGATMTGRALARVGAVTMDTNTIVRP